LHTTWLRTKVRTTMINRLSNRRRALCHNKHNEGAELGAQKRHSECSETKRNEKVVNLKERRIQVFARRGQDRRKLSLSHTKAGRDERMCKETKVREVARCMERREKKRKKDGGTRGTRGIIWYHVDQSFSP
jgi:hypothetical protein